MKFEKKIWKMRDIELEFIGKVSSEGIEKVLVQVKVRNRLGREYGEFATVRLSEFLRLIDEEKLEKI